MIKINIKRLEQNLKELKEIGFNADDGGNYRIGFTDADMQARQWFMQKAEAAGLKSSMDEIGNVFAIDDRAQSDKTFMVGSHLDSVPCGGNLDGALGVLAGLECMQTMLENGIELKENFEVIGTSEEEGRFGGMIGTETFLGEMTQDRIQNSMDSDNITLAEAMQSIGLDPTNALKAARDTKSISGFLELHIEQGPVLEQKGIDIGIVEGISGIIHWRVRVEGEYNHSGTTPMEMRKDAFLGVADFCHSFEHLLKQAGTNEARASVGKLDIVPPNPHTIPGLVEFNVIIRDFDEQSLKKLDEAFREKLNSVCEKRLLKYSIKELSFIPPAFCHEGLTETLEAVAKEHNFNYQRMPSGAGHDTQFFIKHTPSTMFFIPSHKGISHSPKEHTSLELIETGTNFLLQSLIKILAKSNS